MLFEIIDGADKRLKRDEFIGIIIHHTDVGQNPTPSLWAKWSDNITNYLAKKDTNYVSAHYVIKRNGAIAQIIDPEKYEAFHAGKSSYWHPKHRKLMDDWNRYAIGIELIGDGNAFEYSSEQYKSLIELIKFLKSKFNIHPLAIVGHENISPSRKVDPGKLFDWDFIFKGIYGG